MDRRRGPRYRVAHPSIASFGEKGTYPVVIREVGEYGLRLVCARRIPVDSTAQVRLSFPGATFQRTLRVVRCEKTRGGYLLAGEFTGSDEVAPRPVQSYLDYVRRITRGAAAWH
ncbi:MAG TPA: PilZ domain-containing protein [Candidatus Nitrosotenuis sp.]|nr:PilZ domain-containing protein [Candidatus Nitrosotenuis sp.]